MQLCSHRGRSRAQYISAASRKDREDRRYLGSCSAARRLVCFRKEAEHERQEKENVKARSRDVSVTSWIVLGRQSALSRGYNTKQAQQASCPLTTASTLKSSFGVSAMNRGPSETKHRLTEPACRVPRWAAAAGTPGICQFMRRPYGDEINTVE